MWWTDWNHDRWGIKAVKFAWLFNPLSSSSSIIILTVATPHVNPCMSVSVVVKNNFLCLIINHLHQLQSLALFSSKSRALDDQKWCWRQWQIWSLVSRLRNTQLGKGRTQVMKKSTQKSYEGSLSISWWWYLSIFGWAWAWVDKTKVHQLKSTMVSYYFWNW